MTAQDRDLALETMRFRSIHGGQKELEMKRNSSRLGAIIFAVSILIGVVGCAKPKVQLQVSRDRIQQGEDVRVTWTSKDAKQVSLYRQTVDKNRAQVFTPNDTTTYTAVATRGKK